MVDKKHIAWKCRRGMLELDVVFERFLENGFDHLTKEEQATFARLLEESDPVLYGWCLGHAVPEDAAFAELIKKMRA